MGNFITVQESLVVPTGNVGVSWTGQAGFAFKDTSGLVYHVDPYLSNVCSKYMGYHRVISPPVDANNLITDVILFTHEHRDHLDPESVPLIAVKNPSAMFVGPPTCISILLELGISSNRLISIKRGEEKKIGHAKVKAVLAHHTDDSVGYVFNFGGIKIYVTGDTIYSEELLSAIVMEIDVIMTCINGRLGCMNISDAVHLISQIQPRIAVPMHYGMFKENTANPKEFSRKIETCRGKTKSFIMKHGRWYLYNREQGFQLIIDGKEEEK